MKFSAQTNHSKIQRPKLQYVVQFNPKPTSQSAEGDRKPLGRADPESVLL